MSVRQGKILIVIYLFLGSPISIAGDSTQNLIPLSQVPALQIAGTAASKLNMNSLVSILSQNAPATGVYYSGYNVLSNDGHGGQLSAAPLQISQTDDPNHPYIGVFHALEKGTSVFNTYLSYSSDLMSWHTIGMIHHAASMPNLRILSDNSVLLAEEFNPTGKHPYIEITYYGNTSEQTGLQALIKNPDGVEGAEQFGPISTIGANADGTPELSAIEYNGDIHSSSIVVSRHYYMPKGMDTEGLGVLTNFSKYADLGADTQANQALTNAGASAQHGGRSFFYVGEQLYEIVEGNTADQDFGTWSLYLLQRNSDLSVSNSFKLKIEIPGGASSTGNPHISFLSLPDGRPALVLSMFIFSENVGATPAGGHTYIYRLDSASTPITTGTITNTNTSSNTSTSSSTGILVDLPPIKPDNNERAGSYQFSCPSCVNQGSKLSCECKNRRGKIKASTLDLGSCGNGDIANIDGILSCPKGHPAPLPITVASPKATNTPKIPDGSYKGSCSACVSAGNTMSCTCLNQMGVGVNTKLDLNSCAQGDIANINGVLKCPLSPIFKPNLSPIPEKFSNSTPAGSYNDSCVNCLFDGNALSCSCYNSAGREVQSTVNVSGCGVGDIANMDGVLKCSARPLRNNFKEQFLPEL